MKTTILTLNEAQRRQVFGLLIVVILEAVLVVQTVASPSPGVNAQPDLQALRIRNITITYYRAPEHLTPAVNQLDPFDSFLKDATGNLLITPTGTNRVVNLAPALFTGYVLKTHKGTPVLVYQETPSLRVRHKSNCHGYTFLGGDYWLLGSQVSKILDDNGWEVVTASHVRHGDVAVYCERNGRIAHSALVSSRDDRGIIRVNSKSGFDREEIGVPAGSVIPQ